jgi:hemerythrin-like domain-containing protein
MNETSSRLKKEFLQDHRLLTQGFANIQKAIRENNWKKAAKIAERIDRLVGSHIEFEEKVLYPIVAKERGKEYASRLYREHSLAREALIKLIRSKELERMEPEEKEEIIQKVETSIDHAVSCGTLLSHLTALDEEKQKEFLERLLAFRQTHRCWSELS